MSQGALKSESAILVIFVGSSMLVSHAFGFFFFFCILYIFIDWKLHTFFSQTNIVHINRQTRYIIYLHTHPTVPLNSNLLLNIIQVQRSNNARFYIQVSRVATAHKLICGNDGGHKRFLHNKMINKRNNK